MGLLASIAAVAGDLTKATRAPGGPPASEVGPRGYQVDPLWVVSALRYKDKPWGLSYDIQRMVAQRDVVVAAILQVRTHQVGQFARPSRMSQDGRGFVIRARNPKHQLTPVERRWVEAAERFFERCGATDRPRDRFHALLKKIVRDSLTFDCGALELVYDRRGTPVEFVCLDGGSIRIVHSPDAQTPDGYVQVIAGRPVVYFEPDEMLYGVRNPRSDLRAAGYGLSEIELLLRTITNHLYAEDYSARIFTTGSAPRGVFWAEGAELSDEMIVALQRAWQSQLSGVLGAHRIGLLKMPQNSRLNYVDLQKSSEDMGYERWLNYLVSAACSCFLIDPAEINFPNRAGIGEKPPMVTSGEEHRLTQSADKGLRPLMEFFAAYFTEGVLERLPGGDNFVFEFSGVTKRDAKDETAIESQQVRFLKTVNELRQAHDLPEVADGDVILDPTFISHRASQAAARQMQAAPVEEDGMQAWGDEEPEGEPAAVAPGPTSPEQAALAPPVLTERPARTPPLAPRAPRSGP